MNSWLTWSGIKDGLLFLLAVYGAALSTFNWRQAVRRERREIMVFISTVIPTYQNGNTGKCFARVEATNVGHRPVTVTTIALELPTGGRMFSTATHAIPGMPDTIRPASLSDGQSAHLSISYSDIAAALLQSGTTEKIKLTPICLDSSGGIYKGKPWDVDPHEFLKM